MKSSSFKILATALFSIMVISSLGANAMASDLASTANIYLFPKPVQVGDIVLQSSAGGRVSLNDYKGRVVLLHFWSIRCPACRMEEPLLEHTKQSFGPSGLEILGVNLVDPPPAVQQHAVRNRTPFPVLFDGGQGFNLRPVNMGGRSTAFLVSPAQEAILEIPGFPTTYIIDCRGNAVGYSVGPARWNDANAVTLLRNLLSDTGACKLAGLQHRPGPGFPAGPRR